MLVDIGFMFCAMLVIINEHFNAQTHTTQSYEFHLRAHQISDIKILIIIIIIGRHSETRLRFCSMFRFCIHIFLCLISYSLASFASRLHPSKAMVFAASQTHSTHCTYIDERGIHNNKRTLSCLRIMHSRNTIIK